MISFFTVLGLVFSSTVFVLIVINTKRESFSKYSTLHVSAKQSSHYKPTPRIGGLAIATGVLSGALLSGHDIFALILWTTLPIFLIGLFEDLGPDTAPTIRLLAAALSAILAILVLNTFVDRVGVQVIDSILSITVFGVAFTIFASTGMTHAMNLIDGLHGLSSAVVISIMASFGLVAYTFGHEDLLMLNSVVCVAFLGFLLLNFPHGKIFLGDAGAYSIGHIIAWNAILLAEREPNISPWAILLILLWPVFDTLFAMIRRFSTGKPISKPDRLHFHHMLMRLIRITAPTKITIEKSNPIGSLATWPFLVTPCILGFVFINSPKYALLSIGLLCTFYVVSYHFLVFRALRIRHLFT